MTSPITSNVNSIQFLNAQNAFKSSVAQKKESQPEISENVGLPEADNSVLKKYNLDEIKKYAQFSENESELSNEDIKYGITYGRSVIVDYSI